nr:MULTISPECIES: hypothetical protein [Rhizobium]
MTCRRNDRHHEVKSRRGSTIAAAETATLKTIRQPAVVLHLPPGTSKWNKIEHRLFSLISRNWRGRPLTDYRTIVELIAATTSTAGLTVRCGLDENLYPAGIKISDAEMAAINILRHTFHGEWNYTISPRPEKTES